MMTSNISWHENTGNKAYLCKATWFKHARYEEHVTGCVYEMTQWLIICEAEVGSVRVCPHQLVAKSIELSLQTIRQPQAMQCE